MTFDEGAVLLFKWLLAAVVGGLLMLRSFWAIVEREVEGWQGALGMMFAFMIAAMAIWHAKSPWYLAILSFGALVTGMAHMAGVLESRVRAHQMLQADAERYLEAIELDEKNAAAHAFLAAVYRKQGRLEDAIREWEIASALDRNDGESRRRLKLAVRDLQQWEGAVRCPRCDAMLGPGRRTCPNCDWSRSVLGGLRRLDATGDSKRLAQAAGLVTVLVVVWGLIFRMSAAETVTLVVLAWSACVAAYFYWALRESGQSY